VTGFRTTALFAVVALTACTPRPVAVLPPVELTTCAAEPEAPLLPERDGTDATQLVRDRMMLAAYLALRSAYGDCAARVAALKAWRERME